MHTSTIKKGLHKDNLCIFGLHIVMWMSHQHVTFLLNARRAIVSSFYAVCESIQIILPSLSPMNAWSLLLQACEPFLGFLCRDLCLFVTNSCVCIFNSCSLLTWDGCRMVS